MGVFIILSGLSEDTEQFPFSFSFTKSFHTFDLRFHEHRAGTQKKKSALFSVLNPLHHSATHLLKLFTALTCSASIKTERRNRQIEEKKEELRMHAYCTRNGTEYKYYSDTNTAIKRMHTIFLSFFKESLPDRFMGLRLQVCFRITQLLMFLPPQQQHLLT